MSVASSLGRFLLGDYQLYRIYSYVPGAEAGRAAATDVRRIESADQLLESPDQAIRALRAYAGEDSYGYGIWRGDELLSACWYWTGERYKRQRNFWRLENTDAKLVQISTAAAHMGRGLARRLLIGSAQEMGTLGYERLYARIWHSNGASIRLFEKCGWTYTAFVSEIYPFGKRLPFRFVRDRARRRARRRPQ